MSVRCGITLPNFGSAGDARVLVELAVRAEEAGWDGFFPWDHLLVEPSWSLPICDPWTALGAIAHATSRLLIGPMVTAVPRRWPAVLAREAVTLDHLSDGRLVLGAGLGWPSEAEYGWFGQETDVRRRAEMLDEALAILDGLWSGEPFAFDGAHYQVREATFLPRPLQRPRIPVWVGSLRPGPVGPLRRAARWDGFAPAFDDGDITVEEFSRAVRRVLELRAEAGIEPGAPYDLVVIASSPAGPAAADVVAPFVDAGATWWLETVSDRLGGLDAIRARIDAGPPVL